MRCCDAEYGGEPCSACAEANALAWLLMWVFVGVNLATVLWLWVR